MAKKTKKIETPIDQRETFVSIQKNFADSDLSVAEKLKTLYVLQQADTAIDKIHQLRGELPREVENLENEIADLKAKAARISDLIDEYNKSVADNKIGIAECDAQIEKYKSQIENVANSREYDSLNKEIENQVHILSLPALCLMPLCFLALTNYSVASVLLSVSPVASFVVPFEFPPPTILPR